LSVSCVVFSKKNHQEAAPQSLKDFIVQLLGLGRVHTKELMIVREALAYMLDIMESLK
jgi:hypothetical protein